ncbi:MAG TPA: hypothetical protein VFI11_05940 [Anaerolineales bacterium]|nr:hypothetical protein [Anaerolineales bacterium]
MFDNLRELTDRPEPRGEAVSFPTEEYGDEPRRSGRILGMTAGQRLLIAILLFFTVVVMSVMCLLVTERVLII